MSDGPRDAGRGPRVVALGGGHGLAATLRAVRRYAATTTAVVSVADDGGSSGRLRATMAIPAPGDVRRCISALADERSLLGTALEHRFTGGELAGHALGNLLIAGLAETSESFVVALDEICRLVGAAGRVLPAATVPVTLVADTGGTNGVEGQVAVQNSRGIRRLRVRPTDPSTPPEVVAAIDTADQVVIGPGSLFTSVLAAAIVPDVLAALRSTKAPKVYVCNLRPQVPETEGLTSADHLQALLAHDVPVDVMLCHGDGLSPCGSDGTGEVTVVERDLVTTNGTAHDPVLLSDALVALLAGGGQSEHDDARRAGTGGPGWGSG